MALDFNNLSAEEREFKTALETAGIPTDAAEIKAEFQTMADAAGLTITNTSAFSPFWQLITAIAINPVLWLLAFVIRRVMPNLYVKTAAGSFLDLLAWSYDLMRKPATKASGELSFFRDSVGQELAIPKGTAVRTIAINGTVYRLITTANTLFAVNQKAVKVAAVAEKTGAAYNLAAGYYCILESDISGVTGVTNATDWLLIPGDDEETDDLLRLRLRNQFTAVAQWHTDAKYTAMIAERTGFRADRIFFNHEIPRGPGSADAYILFDATTPAQSYLDSVNAYILEQGNHGHGDDLLVKALPETQHDVSVTIAFVTGTSQEQKTALTASIEQFIRCAFRQNANYADQVTQTWAFDRFSFSRLDQELHNQFPALRALSWGQADIISGLNVPRLQTLTMTVQ